MKKCHVISISTLTLLSSVSAPASIAQTVTKLKPITIEARESSLQERQQAPTGIVVIDQTQIDRYSDRTVGGVLRHLPGVLFGGAPGENKDVRIRGLDKEYSQILINGRRIPGGGEKREFQLDQLPVDLIERIEVIRAPTADMDSQGIAGTINIILKKIPENTSFNFTVGANQLQGEDIKPNIGLTYGGQKAEVGYLFSLNAEQRQQLKNKTKESFKADGSADKSEKEKEDKQFEELQLAPRLNWAFSENNTLSIEPLLLYSDEEKEKEKLKFKANGSSDGKELEDENKKRLNWAVNTEFQRIFASGDELTVGLNIQESQEDKEKLKQFFKGDGSADKIENETEDKSDKEWLLSLKGTKYIGERHTLKSGIEFSNKDRTKDKIKTETKNGEIKSKAEAKDKYGITEQRINGYILDEYSLNDRHLFTPGIRFEWTNTKATSNIDIARENKSAIWNPSLHYLFKWSDQTNVRASITRTVRRPKFDDLSPFVDSKDGNLSKPDKVGNPDLLPERATGIDVGLEHYFAKQAGNIGVNLFYRNIDDKIETRVNLNSATSRFEEMSENVGGAKLKGVEMDARLTMSFIGLDNLTLMGNATFLDGEITDKVTGAKTPFKEQPDYVFNLGFEHKLDIAGLSWGVDFNKISKLESDEIKDGKRTVETLKSQNYLDMHIKKSLGDHFELRFSAQNLLKVEKDKLRTIFKADGSIDKTQRDLEQSGRMFFISLRGTW